MFDWDKSSKLRLRQWQPILDLETYINDAGGISYGSLGACHMWRIALGESGIRFEWQQWGGGGGGGGEKDNFTRIFTTTGLDWNVPVDLFIFSIFFYSYHAQTSFLRIKWFQFPLTSYFSPWSVTLWNADLLYDRSFSVPTNHLKQTNINSSTKKIRLTSATNRQAVAHKSRLARYFPSTPGFSCKNLHNFHGFNHSHSQSSHQKDISIPTPLSSFSSFK